MTRAKKRLYAPLLFDQKKKENDTAPIELFFSLLGKPSFEEAIDFLAKEEKISFSLLSPQEVKIEKEPEHPSIAKTIPTIEKKEKRSFIYSFSSLKRDEAPPKDPSASTILPKGVDFGIFTHSILERVLSLPVIRQSDLEKAVDEALLIYPFGSFREAIIPFLERALFTPLKEGLVLANIPYIDRQVEVEFLSPFQSHFMKGFIDIVFSFEGKYYLLDWKTNDLGDGLAAYREEKLKEAVFADSYHLQAAIYTDALKRYLKLVDPRPFSECFGGMFFIFLRGGVYHFFPDTSLLDKMEGYL